MPKRSLFGPVGRLESRLPLWLFIWDEKSASSSFSIVAALCQLCQSELRGKGIHGSLCSLQFTLNVLPFYGERKESKRPLVDQSSGFQYTRPVCVCTQSIVGYNTAHTHSPAVGKESSRGETIGTREEDTIRE